MPLTAETCKKKADGYVNMKITIFSPKRFKDAYDWYCKAVEAFKEDGDAYNAGICSDKAAECMIKEKQGYQAAASYIEAAKCFQIAATPGLAEKSLAELISDVETAEADTTEASTVAEITKDKSPEQIQEECQKIKGIPEMNASYDNAVAQFCQIGKFVQAARTKRQQADMNKMHENYLQTCICLREAAELFEEAKAFPTVNAILEEEAELYAYPMKNFGKAAEIYEEILHADWNKAKTNSGGPSLLQFSVNKLLFYHLLCTCACMNTELYEDECKTILQKMDDLNETKGDHFDKVREYDVIRAICTSLTEKNMKIFLTELSKYDKAVGGLDKWLTKILLHVRKMIEAIVQNRFLTSDLT